MASPVSVLAAAVLVFLCIGPFSVVAGSLSSYSDLEISAISAAPALLPGVPASSPSLPPDITPRLPSPKPGDAVSPSGALPTIPSSRSPPNPDADGAAEGPGSALSPGGAFGAMAASTSAVSRITFPAVSTALLWLSSVFLSK